MAMVCMPPSWTATMLPTMSGRNPAQAGESWDMSSRGPVGVTAPALHDLDEAGGVGVADDVGDDVGAVLEGGLLVNSSAVSDHQRSCRGRSLRRAASSTRSGPGEAAVLGHLLAVEPSQPAGARGELPHPPVERGLDLPGVRHLSLNHLNEHQDPPEGATMSRLRRYRERRTSIWARWPR